MMPKHPRFYFEDILDCITKIELYTQNLTLETFLADSKTQDAVVKNIIVIGEATRLIPENIRNHYAELPYKAIIGMRNILVHNYLGTDHEEVWRTIQDELPTLKTQVLDILQEMKNQ
jgi:uncharacterized protein with HEPN domain